MKETAKVLICLKEKNYKTKDRKEDNPNIKIYEKRKKRLY